MLVNPLKQDRMYRPVCGTDGKTYERECSLETATCESGGRIELDHYGECERTMMNEGLGWGGGRLPMWGGFGGDFEEEEVETCDNIDCERRERNPVCGMIQSKTQVYVNACTMRAQSCALTGMLDGIEKVGKPKNGKCKTKTKPKEQFSMFGGRFPVFGRNRFGREAEEVCSMGLM